jgi:hypothetical protein
MPTVLWDGPYRFFFFSGDEPEREHIHVARDDGYAKFWLDPVDLAWSRGFKKPELNTIVKIVTEKRETFSQAWHAHFNQ